MAFGVGYFGTSLDCNGECE